MALKVKLDNFSYGVSGKIAAVSMSLELYDDEILDAESKPVVLWQGTVSEKQNLTDNDALNKLVTKLKNKIKSDVEAAVNNAIAIKNVAGTYDPIQLGQSILVACQAQADETLNEVIGG